LWQADRKLLCGKVLLVLLLLFAVVFRGGAQNIKVNARLDTGVILLGDQTVLRLSAELPKGTPVIFPLLGDTLSAKVQIVSAGRTDTLPDQHDPAVLRISRAYTVTSFDPGMQVVPALVFQSGGKTYATEALPLEVQSVKVDTTKAIYDIKQPLAVSYTFLDWLKDHWHWVVIGLMVLLVLLGAWFYFRKIRKPKPVVLKPEPLRPAHVKALELLDVLEQKKLWQQGQVKAYYIELTDIVRDYLEQRYGIHALEQTTDEILSSLSDRAAADLSADSRNVLKELLLLADLVKFAKFQPSNADNVRCLEEARRFVSNVAVAQQKGSEGDGVV